MQLQKSFGYRKRSQLNKAAYVFAANAGQQCMHTAMKNPFETFQCGKAEAREQPSAPVAVSTQPISSKITVSQASAGNSSSGDLVSRHCQKLTASPGSQHTGTSLLSGAQASSSNATVSVSKYVKRKRSSKAEQLPSLQDAPGLPEKLGDHPLRLIIVGHNPSDHAWRTGHYYSNPSNWMWRILIATRIAPGHVTGPEHDDCMASDAGIGFTDVGSGIPGTVSSQFDSATFQSWGAGFYERLSMHMSRASDSIGCSCGKCGAPALVAFSGKRQWSELINTGRKGKSKVTKFAIGPQNMRPEGWPLPDSTEVWVMTSTSGASPMTTEARMAPWHELSKQLTQLSWPRQVDCCCTKSLCATRVTNGVCMEQS